MAFKINEITYSTAKQGKGGDEGQMNPNMKGCSTKKIDDFQNLDVHNNRSNAEGRNPKIVNSNLEKA